MNAHIFHFPFSLAIPIRFWGIILSPHIPHNTFSNFNIFTLDKRQDDLLSQDIDFLFLFYKELLFVLWLFFSLKLQFWCLYFLCNHKIYPFYFKIAYFLSLLNFFYLKLIMWYILNDVQYDPTNMLNHSDKLFIYILLIKLQKLIIFEVETKVFSKIFLNFRMCWSFYIIKSYDTLFKICYITNF
jgi:hypothetical protein